MSDSQFITQGINYSVASAANLPAPYQNTRPMPIPTTFFIDRQGVIQFVVVGALEFETVKEFALTEDFEGEPKPAPTAPAGQSTNAAPK